MTTQVTAPAARTFDALELELFRHSILSVVDELEVNLTRTSYSPLIYEYKDYCIGFVDARFRLISQSKGSLPIFVADLGLSVGDAVGVIGVDNLEPGDVFITNYAPVAGQHLNNVVVASPVFDEARRLRGYICIRAHWADVGGMNVGSVTWAARDIFQEGVQYRGLRVVRRGVVAGEVLKTIEANTRMPKFVLGTSTPRSAHVRSGSSAGTSASATAGRPPTPTRWPSVCWRRAARSPSHACANCCRTARIARPVCSTTGAFRVPSRSHSRWHLTSPAVTSTST